MADTSNSLGLSSPWMNAAGFMGYLPQTQAAEKFTPGAFVTNPISLEARSPARDRTIKPYAGGFLLHTGHANPGIKRVLREYAPKWKNLSMPVWAHLLVSGPYDCEQMVRELEGHENITAIELGLPPGMGVKNQLETIKAAVGELPVMVCLPLDEINHALLDQLSGLGEIGLALSAPRGMLVENGKLARGRLFGPGLFPQMMAALLRWRGAGLPLVAGTGIFSREQGEEALQAGAAAVQVDGWCWKF